MPESHTPGPFVAGAYAGKSWRGDAFKIVENDDGAFDVVYGASPESVATCYTRENADTVLTALRTMFNVEVYAMTVGGHRIFGGKAAILATESALRSARGDR